ncbi:hypothetical protein AB0F57_05240 [Streptomyces tanashiensis]|uniref:GNAT family N-acetyltransferase n=1 Tax=Streptomyces tanashiensis TaxID=67367 RepID=UPI0033CC59AA
MPDFSHQPTLTGDLVVLRPVTEADVPALLPVFEDPEVTRLTGNHTHFDEATLVKRYGSRGATDNRLSTRRASCGAPCCGRGSGWTRR